MAADPTVSVLHAFVTGADLLLAALVGTASDDIGEDDIEADDVSSEGALSGGRSRAQALGQRVSGVLGTSGTPRTPGWADDPIEARTAWWITRVGRVTASLASACGQAGPIADQAVLQSALTVAGRGLLLCALAHEQGVTDHDGKVRLLASLLLGRTVPVSGAVTDRSSDDLVAGVRTDLRASAGMVGLGRAATRLGRAVIGVRADLQAAAPPRPRGIIRGRLPSVTRIVGDYRSERQALQVMATAAQEWIAKETGSVNRRITGPVRPASK